MKRLLCALLIAPGMAAAQTVDPKEGLAAWARIYAVVSHPRCTNCHVGDQPEPMWEGLGYGAGVKHGMGIKADSSRIGAETLPCRTCHVTARGTNTVAHGPAQIEVPWQLPPVELGWLGKDSQSLCLLLRDGDGEGGADIASLAAHLERSPFVAWGFNPGGGRSSPPGSALEMARDVRLWGAAGLPCE